MIDVQDLRKSYGPVAAVDGISFSIRPGEVVGLLGPNGAGKTTTMKILTGYLPATAGAATVAGFDVAEASLEVRRRVGYLPESNPLYEDLEVTEHLEYVGRLRGMTNVRGRIREVLAACGLTDMAGRIAGTLSRGYRQRLGFACAILHDPEILILDEPTSGLDPNQQREVRALIRELKQSKTVILSTHILSEVHEVCDRVLVIHHGRIAADGTAAELQQAHGSGGWSVRLELPEADKQAVAELAAARGWAVVESRPAGASLEEIFRKLTES